MGDLLARWHRHVPMKLAVHRSVDVVVHLPTFDEGASGFEDDEYDNHHAHDGQDRIGAISHGWGD